MSKMTLLWVGGWTRQFQPGLFNDSYVFVTNFFFLNMLTRFIPDVERFIWLPPAQGNCLYFLPGPSPIAKGITTSTANDFCSQFNWASLFLTWDRVLTLFKPTHFNPDTPFSIIFYFITNIFFSAQWKVKLWIQKVIISEPDEQGDSITDNKQNVGTGLVNCLARHCSLTKHVWNV